MSRSALTRIRGYRLPSLRELLRLAVLALLVLAAIGSTQLLPSASAQDADEDAGSSDRSNAVTTDQASEPDRSLSVPGVPGNRGDGLAPTDQLSSATGRPTLPSQLTVPGQDAGQLGAERIEGEDACDEARSGAEPAICNRPIETRAGEFAGRRQPGLSAEQRLLAQQASTSAQGDAPDATARRLGAGRSADLSNDDLAIAAVVTQGQTGQAPPAEEEASDIPADATNAIDAILGAIVNAPPPR